MKSIWIKIFQAGKQTDSSGRSKEWTEADLDSIVEKYNSKSPKEYAPLIMGDHEKSYVDSDGKTQIKAAHGYVEELKRDGEFLMANVLPSKELVEAVRNNNYKQLSIGLSDGMLDHIAILGKVKPAVKGLPLLEFSEQLKEDVSEVTQRFQEISETIAKGEAETVNEDGVEAENTPEAGTDNNTDSNYEEPTPNNPQENQMIPPQLQGLHDALIEYVKAQLGDETATVVAAGFVESLQKYTPPAPVAPQVPQQAPAAPQQPAAPQPQPQFTEQEKQRMDRLTRLERENFTLKVKEKLNGPEYTGRLTPAQKEKAVAMFIKMNEANGGNFSEATMDETLDEFLKSLPEHNLNEKSEADAQEYVEKEKSLAKAIEEYNKEKGFD